MKGNITITQKYLWEIKPYFSIYTFHDFMTNQQYVQFSTEKLNLVFEVEKTIHTPLSAVGGEMSRENVCELRDFLTRILEDKE